MSRHLLVTGGSRGIGAQIVRGAVAAGDRVTFTYRDRADAADALVTELGPATRAVQGDVATPHEREVIIRALDGVDGNVASAADQLGVPRKTLYDKLKKYQLATGKK